MNKLKTLNDLKIEYKENISLQPKDKLYEYEQGKEYAKSWIKEEAIKWIEELNRIEKKELEWINDGSKELSNMKIFDEFRGTDYNDFEEVRNWIKYFFGIKDEDLK